MPATANLKGGVESGLRLEDLLDTACKKTGDLPDGSDALRLECCKLNEENQLLKRCLRLMRDNSALECATLLSAVISFCDNKFKRKFAEGLDSLGIAGVGGGGPAGAGYGFTPSPQSGKSYISGATGSPDGQGYQYEEPERDVPVQDVPEKESAARDAYPIRGVPKKKPWKPKTPKYVDDYRSIAEARAAQAEAVAREKNFTLPSDPDSQHTKSHVYTHTPIASDLEYDPLYLKAKILEEGYRQLMKGDTSPVPATLPFKKQSTGTLVHKICRTPPTILFHNKKLRNKKGQKSSHSCYEKLQTPITPFSRLGGKVPTKKPQKRLFEVDLRTMGSPYSQPEPPPGRYPKVPSPPKPKAKPQPVPTPPVENRAAPLSSVVLPADITIEMVQTYGMKDPGPSESAASSDITIEVVQNYCMKKEPEPPKPDGYDYRKAIGPIIEQARQSLGMVTGSPMYGPGDLTSYMVRHEHTDTTYLADGSAKVIKDTHKKMYHWADEEEEDAGSRNRLMLESEGESLKASSSTGPRTDSENEYASGGGPMLTSSDDFATKQREKNTEHVNAIKEKSREYVEDVIHMAQQMAEDPEYFARPDVGGGKRVEIRPPGDQQHNHPLEDLTSDWDTQSPDELTPKYSSNSGCTSSDLEPDPDHQSMGTTTEYERFREEMEQDRNNQRLIEALFARRKLIMDPLHEYHQEEMARIAPLRSPERKSSRHSLGRKSPDRASSVHVLGRESPVHVIGRESPVHIRGRESPQHVHGRESPVQVRGRESPVIIRGRDSPVQVRGRDSPVHIRGRESPGPESPLAARGPARDRVQSPLLTLGRESPMTTSGREFDSPMLSQGTSPTRSRGPDSPLVSSGREFESPMLSEENEPPTRFRQRVSQLASQGEESPRMSQQQESPTRFRVIESPLVSSGQECESPMMPHEQGPPLYYRGRVSQLASQTEESSTLSEEHEPPLRFRGRVSQLASQTEQSSTLSEEREPPLRFQARGSPLTSQGEESSRVSQGQPSPLRCPDGQRLRGRQSPVVAHGRESHLSCPECCVHGQRYQSESEAWEGGGYQAPSSCLSDICIEMSENEAKRGGSPVPKHMSLEPVGSPSFSTTYSDVSGMQVQHRHQQQQGQQQISIPAALVYSGRNMLGEVAFQLERRILDYVFAKCLPDTDLDSSGGARRRRFYGYTVYNIGEMINREALAGERYSRGTERMLRERLRTLLDILTPLGYDLVDHGRFSQDTINKYGLLSHPPAAKANDVETEVGIPGVTVTDVQNFIVYMTDSEFESSNLLLIFDCLRMLAIEDGRQLFVW